MAGRGASVHVFGVRHHGPGSARSLLGALEALEPDAVLVEGPPDADRLLPLALDEAMEPPVALLVYRADDPSRAAFYPFAVFSPEWQAIRYGLSRGVEVRFMDLPQAYLLAEEPSAKPATPGPAAPGPAGPEQAGAAAPRRDPLDLLAEAAGYDDGERWWERMVEQRLDGADLFAAVAEAMAALRDAALADGGPVEARREAHMRSAIRAAERAGRRRVAVVCGAWHAPALADRADEKEDAALLDGLPATKVEATWAPWTYGRLAAESGYGAGVASPGWYHHLWTAPDRVAVRWMRRVAELLRAEGLDASPGHLIETVRLAESLAALDGRPLPDLSDLLEATRAVLCFGDDAPVRLVRERLVVGERLGRVPDAAPMVPLQVDLEREQRRLRLAPDPVERVLDLDLRKQTDLDRSRLLHRLSLLGVAWGRAERAAGARGTFREVWRLAWQPEFAVRLVEAAAWGQTVREAASARAVDEGARASDLAALAALVDRVLLADLPGAAARLVERVEAEAALSSDVGGLMDALPPLAGVLRYGNVRRTDAAAVRRVVDGIVARVSVGLVPACASLDDAAAAETFARLGRVDAALAVVDDAEYRRLWYDALARVADLDGANGLVAGRAVRLLLDAGAIAEGEAARRLALALSAGTEPARSAAWVEGLLKGSGLVLVHDDALWRLLDEWVCGLGREAFDDTFPLLRRTFATFAPAERRRLGERARREPGGAAAAARAGDFDEARAGAVLPIVARLLGRER